MNYLNGGYVMIKHNATQKDLANAYKTNRPVLVYDENQKAHWCQINEKVIETTDEETQETITTYEYSYQLLNDIASLVDSAGNPRFIEGDGTGKTLSGLTISYCKWSLSGTHLMVVCAGNITNGTTLTTGNIATFTLPEWILNKIYPVWSSAYIEKKDIKFFADNFTEQTTTGILSKGSTSIAIYVSSALALTANRAFRIQFDLLIDTDYSE